MTSQQLALAAMTRMAQEQRAQIRRLVQLLMDVLNEVPGSRAEASHYVLVETKLYQYIEGEA